MLIVTLLVRPRVSIKEMKVVAVVGDDAVFECEASGDPQPTLTWRRIDGLLPAGRARPTSDRSGLKVTPNDRNMFHCFISF